MLLIITHAMLLIIIRYYFETERVHKIS